MGQRTGRPRGRPAGAKNKNTRTKVMAEVAERMIARLGGDAFDGDAHAFLMLVYKDIDQPMPMRLDAAKAAVAYEKPRLASIDTTGEAVKRSVVRMPARPKDMQEWLATHSPKSNGTPPTMQ